MGGVILQALFRAIIVHPNPIHNKEMFIWVLFIENSMHSSIIIENTNTIHSILTIHTGHTS